MNWLSDSAEGSPAQIAWHGALPQGTVLRGYLLRKVLGQGGFGIVYQAQHLELGNLVAIKEYLPVDLAVRKKQFVQPRSAACIKQYEDGLRRFRNEGKALVEFQDHPNIVSCRDFFRGNGTAYLVMEFEDGRPLSHILWEREEEGHAFDEEDLLNVAIPLLEGLGRIHEAGVVHRDIKPANVLIRKKDGQPVLIDFGAAKQDLVVGQDKSMAPRTPGYAAWEQVVADGGLGPWTDIYGLGVLLWRIVAGGVPRTNRHKTPVPVESRMDALLRGAPEPMPPAAEVGKGRFHAGVLAAIDGCLKLRHDERVQNCPELLALLRLDQNIQYETAMKIYRRIGGPPDCHESPDIWQNREDVGDELSEIVKWLSLAASADHPAAQYELAFMYHFGVGTKQNKSAARHLIHQAASFGYVRAQVTLSYLYNYAYIYSRFEECYGVVRGRKAASALFELCSGTYDNSYRILPDDDDYRRPDLANLASKWICLVEIGSLYDSYHYLYSYYYRSPTSRDEILSKLAPLAPLSEIHYEIGHAYHFSHGVDQDYQTASQWYRRAAIPENGNWTVTQQAACKSADLNLRELARLGIDSAKRYCWEMYKYDRITPIDVNEAMRFLRFGAAYGDILAEYNLGWMYWNGKGVLPDYIKGIDWYRRAAEQGHADAQNNLGVSYALGKGVPQDYEKAKAWFYLAIGNYNLRLSIDYRAEHLLLEDQMKFKTIQWEDKRSQECFDRAHEHLVSKLEGWEENCVNIDDICLFPMETLSPMSHKSEKSLSDFFLPFNTITLGYARAIYNFGVSKYLSRHSQSVSYKDTIRSGPENWFDPLMTWAAEYHYPSALYNRSLYDTFTTEDRLDDIIFRLHLAADQNHVRSQQLLSITYAIFDGIDPRFWSSEDANSLNLLKWYWLHSKANRVNIFSQHSSYYYSLDSVKGLGQHLSEALEHYSLLLSPENSSLIDLEVQQAGFELGIWGGDISINLILPNEWYEWFPLTHSGRISHEVLGLLRTYRDQKGSGPPWDEELEYNRQYYDGKHLYRSGAISDDYCALEYKGSMYSNCTPLLRTWFGYSRPPDSGPYRPQYYSRQSFDDPTPYSRWFDFVDRLRFAAVKGDPEAQLVFGMLYASGDGVSRDYELALEFLCCSAAQGNANACLALGILYERGYGVCEDQAESKKWYRIAVDAGVDVSKVGVCANSLYKFSLSDSQRDYWETSMESHLAESLGLSETN